MRERGRSQVKGPKLRLLVRMGAMGWAVLLLLLVCCVKRGASRVPVAYKESACSAIVAHSPLLYSIRIISGHLELPAMMMQSAVAACRRMGFGGGLVRRAVAGAGAGVVRPVRAAGECGLVRRQQPLTHVVAAPAIMPVRPGVRPLSALNSGLQQQHAEQRQRLAFPGARFNSTLSAPDYHKLSDAWLEGMCDTFEDLIDSAADAADYDVTYAVSHAHRSPQARCTRCHILSTTASMLRCFWKAIVA